MLDELLLALALVQAVACGASGAPPDGAIDVRNPSTALSAAATRPSCDAIDEACDAHEHEGGRAKECHDFAESPRTAEAACLSRKAECLAACPPKAH
jgi:hypothetical protein